MTPTLLAVVAYPLWYPHHPLYVIVICFLICHTFWLLMYYMIVIFVWKFFYFTVLFSQSTILHHCYLSFDCFINLAVISRVCLFIVSSDVLLLQNFFGHSVFLFLYVAVTSCSFQVFRIPSSVLFHHSIGSSFDAIGFIIFVSSVLVVVVVGRELVISSWSFVISVLWLVVCLSHF